MGARSHRLAVASFSIDDPANLRILQQMAAPRVRALQVMVLVGAAACGDDGPRETAAPGVVFTFPVDGQLDVPTGVRIVVTFSDKVTESAIGACGTDGSGGFCLVGPDGPVAAMPAVVGDGKSVEIPAGQLDPGTPYELHVGPALAPFAKNMPSGPLVRFTTRSARPRSAPPQVLAVNGNEPARLGEAGARPMFDFSTIHLLFSEPLDPRTVDGSPGSVELVAGGAAVPATLIAEGVHVAIDPRDDLTPGTTYQLRLGSRITDLGGQALAPVSYSLVPLDTRGTGRIPQVLKTRQPSDPGPKAPRAAAQPNVILLDKPLIGREEVAMQESVLAGELSDPQVLGGPIAFTIRRGQRLRTSGLDVKLGGQIPVGLSTGDLQIELLTDASGRLYRNPHQDPAQPPENGRAPLYVDLTMDLAVFATDPLGNAALSQTVLGVQASGVATPTQGVLAIETVASMDLGLLGVTSAPSNLVLELITSPGAVPPVDTQGPKLVATYPADLASDFPVDAGIELVFDEPVDLDRLRAGGLRLEDGGPAAIPIAIESHGAAVVVRPLSRLQYGTDYRVLLPGVADVAGNALGATAAVRFGTPRLVATSAPMTVVAIRPGVPCALIGATAASPGRCAGSASSDDLYHPFTLEREQSIEVELSQPVRATSAVLGAACGTGSVRVEELSAGGGCVGVVPGGLVVRERSLEFVPDRPWAIGGRYRFVLVSGDDAPCGAGELCGANGVAASFDPLGGNDPADAGGPNLEIVFTGVAPSGATSMIARAGPFTDVNGSGLVEGGEVSRDDNRAALRITGMTGQVTSASFTSPDCLPGTPETEGCMYLLGALPVALGEVSTDCPLPGGGSAPSCVPVSMSPQAMFATSVPMHVVVSGVFAIDQDTKTADMRIREPASGPLVGYIIDGGGGPKLVAALELYMDAPDMVLPLGTKHDLHSKKLTVGLEGPVSFLPDGRIAIAASNTADLPVEVVLSTDLGTAGSIKMIVPQHEMKLRLLSPPLRGVSR